MNFISALAYHFCLALPAASTQPGDHLLAEPCTGRIERCGGRLRVTNDYRARIELESVIPSAAGVGSRNLGLNFHVGHGVTSRDFVGLEYERPTRTRAWQLT